MNFDFCDKTMTVDGDACELYDSFVDKYFLGIIRVEVCNYRCESGRIISRIRSRVFCILVDEPFNRVFDPTKPPPDDRGICDEEIKRGVISCKLAATWELKLLGGIMRIRICIYSCADDVFYHARWRTSFFGFPLPWRGRSSFPNPI